MTHTDSADPAAPPSSADSIAAPGSVAPPASRSGQRRRRRPGRAGPGARRDRQGDRRSGRHRDRPGARAAVPRPRAARGRARRGQDAAGAGHGRVAVAGHEADAVHPRPDAQRRHRLAGLRRPRGRVRVPPGPGLHQPVPRRRDQPDAAEDAGVAAGGDGGAAGLGRGHPAPAARAVPGRGHPEPDRVRGHLPAAGGAAGPVPVQAHRAAADPRRGARRAAGAPPRLRSRATSPRPA